MADLMVDYITSLDGFGAAEGWPGLWGLGGPEYLQFLKDDAEVPATVLMGGTTYRLFRESGEPGELRGRPKLVFSSRERSSPPWEATSLIRGDAVEAVRTMKREQEGLLRTIGSPGLCRSLIRAGLVDRVRVVVFPVVTGASGRDRMYDGWPDVTMELLWTRTLDGSLQLSEFAPTVLAVPPQSGEAWAGNSAEARERARNA